MSANFDAHLDAVFGAQRSGKSCWMKIETVKAKPARLLVWDPKHEYGGFGDVVTKIPELVRAALSRDRFRLVFHPMLSLKKMRDQFNVFCDAANLATHTRVVVDELADVTTSNWAPAGWEILTRQGGHARLVVQGASQRPADVDKSFYGNATRLIVFRLQAEGDLELMRRRLLKPQAEIAGLAKLEYFERPVDTGLVSKKILSAKDLARIPL